MAVRTLNFFRSILFYTLVHSAEESLRFSPGKYNTLLTILARVIDRQKVGTSSGAGGAFYSKACEEEKDQFKLARTPRASPASFVNGVGK